MLTLHYAGPKPFINQHGVFFKDGKEDKYIYLRLAAKILLYIDNISKKSDHFIITLHEKQDLTDNDIIDIIKFYEPDIEKKVLEEEQKYNIHIQEMIDEVKETNLTDLEKDVWIKNINIMKPYMLQREINKLYYIHYIKKIKQIIKHENIKELDITFDLEHWHILESIAGNLEYGVDSVSTSMKAEANEDGILVLKLIIN